MDWNKKCRPPLHDGELISCIKSAYKYNPNIPNQPNQPNNPNIPNLKEDAYLIKHFLEKKKIPFQNVGRGIHNGVCYIATYIEDDDGKTHTAVVTSDKTCILILEKKNQIRNSFGLHYREEFYNDVLDTYWSNEIIKNGSLRITLLI